MSLGLNSSDQSGNETETTDGETDELVGVTTQSSDPVSNRRQTNDQSVAKSGAVLFPTGRNLRSSATSSAPQKKRHSEGPKTSRKRARTINSPMDASDVR